MKNELVFVKINEWMSGFYNLPESMPLFKEDCDLIEKTSSGYDCAKGYEAVKFYLSTAQKEISDKRFELFVKKWPIMIELNNKIESQDYNGATLILEDLIKIDSDDPSCFFHYAFVLKRIGKFERSISEYKKCILMCPDEGTDLGMIYSNLARTFMEMGDRENAVITYKQALEVLPGDVYILEELTNLKEFFSVYTDPNNVESLIYMEKNAYITSMEKHVEDCNQPEQLYEYSNILFSDELFDLSLEAVEKFIKLRPDDRVGGLLKCEILRTQKKYEAAQEIITELLKSFPECPDVNFVQAKILLEEGEVNKGIDLLVKSLNLFPDFVDAIYLYYMILSGEDRVDEALDYIETLGNDFEESWAPYYEIACHYIRNFDFEKSLVYLYKSYSRNPHSQKVLSALSGQLGNNGRHEEVIKILWEPYHNRLFSDHTLFWNFANALKSTHEIHKTIEVLQNMLKTPGLNPIYYKATADELEFLNSHNCMSES
ncbi:tetratricopeptide repeat protein [bacterium]|nr:tetratricopeptide repeat protein [bacterium]